MNCFNLSMELQIFLINHQNYKPIYHQKLRLEILLGVNLLYFEVTNLIQMILSAL